MIPSFYYRLSILIITFLFLIAQTSAQDTLSNKLGKWGVKAGYFHSILSFHESRFGGLACSKINEKLNSRNLPGLRIGAFYENNLNEHFSLLSGVDILFTKAKFEFDYDLFCIFGLAGERAGSVTVGPINMTIPLIVRYKMKTHGIFIETGAFFSISTGASSENTYTKYWEFAPPVLLPEPIVTHSESSVQLFTMGIHAGAGKQIILGQKTFELKLQYYYGLNKSVSFDTNYSLIHSGVEFSIALRI